MISKLIRNANVAILSVLLPYIYGCSGGGGGGGNSLSELLGPGAGTGAGATTAGAGSGIDAGFLASSLSTSSEGLGNHIASIHNPEPTTMALLGSGIMAMAFLMNKSKKS